MNYWERRQQELDKALEKDEEKLKKRLSSYFDTEYRKLEKQIAAYYKQYGTDNVIQYRRLMEELPDEDKRLLIEQMDEFAKKYPKYAHLMPIRESIYKLNRLEGLQYSVQMQQLEIGAVENEQITEHLKRQAALNANAAAETMGFGKNFYSEDSELVKKIVNAKWCNGKDFSENIWGNIEKFANYLNTDIAQGLARGDSYERLTRQLRQRFGKVSRNDAYRLIYTEGTYVMNEARAAAFETDTEEYVFRVQYDKPRRSGWRDICDDLNGKVFKYSERKPGINFPPMHPWCHCTATPHISDREKWMDDYERRHGNGEAQKFVNRMSGKEREIYNKGLSLNGMEERNKTAHDITEKYTIRKSKWSGKFTVDDKKCKAERILGRKEWSCDILLSSKCQDRTIIHEHLHARSGSYLNPISIIKYKNIEEASVEFLAREICKAEGIAFTPNKNHKVKYLYELNRELEICDSDLDFATALFAKHIKTRYNWLNDQVMKRIEEAETSKKEYLLKIMESLKGYR